MLTNDARGLSERELADKRRQSRRYWDAHPISTDAVGHEPGSAESFAAIYERWQATFDEARREFLASVRGKRVLEVGCGIAIDGRKIVEHGGDWHGLDHSRRSLELAQRNFEHGRLPRPKLVQADATRLPFADDVFDVVISIGVLHHVPGIADACREVVRVLRPGGTARIMLYARRSWHYGLVRWGVAPLIRAALGFPPLAAALRFGPSKLRELYAISRASGYSKDRILAASADTSFAGDDNTIPVSGFFTEREMRDLFPGLEGHRWFRADLKYFPLPFLRRLVEPRWGFFLTMTATKSAR